MPSRILIYRLAVLALAVCFPMSALADTSSIKWRTDLDAAMIEAAQSKRLLLLHFWTTKCGPCVVLEQNVFSQPHVGPAIEQDYVPVKIDADAKPALASQFRIDRVPTEIVMTPQGNVVATLSTPDKADAYVAQLQNLARHFRQTTGGGAGGVPQANVNPAYSSLPVSPALPRPQANEYTQNANSAPGNASGPVAQQPATSQVQGNPYVASSDAGRYGQAQNVYGSQTQSPYQQPGGAAATPNGAAGAMTMPSNAMPRSFRNPLTAEAAAAPAVAAGAIASASPAATAPTVQTPAGPALASPAGGAAPPAQAAIAAAMAATAATAATPAIAAATKPQVSGQSALPAGAPPVAFDGCCPVTLKAVKKWTAGNPALGIVHRGRTYLFAGEAERNQFWADPDGYSPVFAGLDPVLLLEAQQSVPGTRQYGYEYGGLFYLFSSKETMDRFASSPNSYAAGVRQAMSRIDASGADVLRR